MFKNLFFQAKALPELSSQLDADIPRYPPFLKGLPAASPEDLQSTQDVRISVIPNSDSGVIRSPVSRSFS